MSDQELPHLAEDAFDCACAENAGAPVVRAPIIDSNPAVRHEKRTLDSLEGIMWESRLRRLERSITSPSLRCARHQTKPRGCTWLKCLTYRRRCVRSELAISIPAASVWVPLAQSLMGTPWVPLLMPSGQRSGVGPRGRVVGIGLEGVFADVLEDFWEVSRESRPHLRRQEAQSCIHGG